VRCLANFDLFTDEWFDMASHLDQIIRITSLETGQLTYTPDVADQQGRKDCGTLWDQECDEVAIRILLEEGKLNLALRLLTQFKKAQLGPKFHDLLKESALKSDSGVTYACAVEKCADFEANLGILLKLALSHVESLQILDVSLLITLCLTVLTHLSENVDAPLMIPDLHKTQESLVFAYLSGLSANIEEMDEQRIMDDILEAKLVQLAIEVIHKHHASFSAEVLKHAVRFLSNVMNTEIFSTEADGFVGSQSTKENCAGFGALFLEKLFKDDAKFKREIRPFSDTMRRWSRKASMNVLRQAQLTRLGSQDGCENENKSNLG